MLTGEITTATVDRLLRYAHVVTTTGDGHRLSEALSGNGVVALG
jgi:hypothetical protein